MVRVDIQINKPKKNLPPSSGVHTPGAPIVLPQFQWPSFVSKQREIYNGPVIYKSKSTDTGLGYVDSDYPHVRPKPYRSEPIIDEDRSRIKGAYLMGIGYWPERQPDDQPKTPVLVPPGMYPVEPVPRLDPDGIPGPTSPGGTDQPWPTPAIPPPPKNYKKDQLEVPTTCSELETFFKERGVDVRFCEGGGTEIDIMGTIAAQGRKSQRQKGKVRVNGKRKK